MARILVVDANPAYGGLTEIALSSIGQTADGACAGQEALQLLADSTYDLVVADVSLPDMNGVSLVQAIKGRHPDLPVVITSNVIGALSVETTEALRECRVVSILEKPYKLQELYNAVEEELMHRRET